MFYSYFERKTDKVSAFNTELLPLISAAVSKFNQQRGRLLEEMR